MTKDEIIAHKDKPVLYDGSEYILRKARHIRTRRGEWIQVKLQDTKVKNSYVIARAQDIQAIKCP